jgi:hypothetical protein
MEKGSASYIRFRLGNIDSYQASPTSLDRDEFPKVPIIRIWGAADESGQTVRVHFQHSILIRTLSRSAVMCMEFIRTVTLNTRET